VRRGLIAAALVLLVAVAAYFLRFRETAVEPNLVLPPPTATIGSGEDAIAVGPGGQVLAWLPLPEGVRLPRLPLAEPPLSGQLAGPALEQARVLGAAPAALRPYIASSYHGESGVDVELATGIELRFGDSSQVGAKWKAASAVLADPAITALDYVNVHAPRRPTIGGSGHALPPVP
jgi:hypothetical protein